MCSGSSIASLNASCSRFTTSGGMPFGPTKPYGELDTVSMPSSFTVGAFQRVRLSPSVASSRKTPASTWRPQPVESTCAMMCPPISALAPIGLALERHVQELHVRLGADLLHREVQRGAGARRAVGQLARDSPCA